ncbi:MAG: ABC transporter substrate-binding protein [Eubacteriales bacterium]|nr:ABC transporter substrate-binding protein [Eubacteriales bacterium]
MSKMRNRSLRDIFVLLCLMCVLIGCASKKQQEGWLKDGIYDVSVALSGGTGKVIVESPTKLTVKDGEMTSKITWSSPHYDYMIVDGQKYLPVNTEGNAVFEIPVRALDEELEVIADTTAMSEPHEITYSLLFCLKESEEKTEPVADQTDNSIMEKSVPEVPGHPFVSETERTYAKCFRIYHYEDGYEVIDVENGETYLLIPEDGKIPDGMKEEMVVIRKPIEKIYVAATASMALFARLDAVSSVRFAGTDAEGWYIDAARKAMEDGEVLYAGKYSEPDYEMLVDGRCGLAVESTMIFHSPKVKEMITDLGIPVFVDYSSYEKKAMGRTEWIKVYGALLDKEAEANAFFLSQMNQLEKLEVSTDEKKTVAFFYISESGVAVVRSPSDYIADMIEEAGGKYIFDDLDVKQGSSSVNMSMEEFYSVAADADYLIYNSTVQKTLTSTDELIKKSDLFKEFRAVKEGNVWCVGKNMYQATDITGEFIADVHQMLSGENADEMTFLTHVE